MPWPWPFSSQSGKDDEKPGRRPVAWTDSLNGTDWQHFRDPRNWVPTVLMTTTILVSVQFYRSYLRRIPGAIHVQPSFFRKRSLFGKVTSVGDGDNFHLFHTPGGRLMGWGWMRSVPEKKPELRGKTVSSSSLLHSSHRVNIWILDSHSPRRYRRAGGRTLRPTCSTLFDRRTIMAL